MNTATVAAPVGARSFKEVWVISLGHALTHWYPATFYLLLPMIGKELGLSYTEIGFIMTVQHLAGALSNVPGGMIVDTFGRKGILMATSLFWVGFPYALMSVTHSYAMLLVCVALVGIGNNLWHPTAISTLANRYPERRGLVLSFHGMGGNVGEALAPLVIGAMLAWMSWRTVVVVNVIPGLIMSVMILGFLGALSVGGGRARMDAGDQKQSLDSYLAGLRALLANRGMLLIAFSGLFRSMTQSSLLTFLPLYLAYELGYSTVAVGTAMFVLQAAGFASSPVSGYLSDKLGRRKIMMSSMAMSAVVLVAMTFAGKSAAFIVFVALLGFFMYAARPVIQAWAMEISPKNMGGTAVGLLFGTQAIGAGISPAISGLIADAHGIFAAFYFLAGTIVVANLFILFMPKETSAPANSAA